MDVFIPVAIVAAIATAIYFGKTCKKKLGTAYVEENGPITYMKYSYQNDTDTIVCDKASLMQPFNCEIQEP